MTQAFLIQFAGSAVAVALLVGLAAWLGRPKALPHLDDAQARAFLTLEYPGRSVDGVWVTTDGRGALARSGDLALVLYAAGDGLVARHLAWSAAMAARPVAGSVQLALGDFAAPRARLAFSTWPPGGPD
jgi:hypothetical protein